MNNLAIIVEDRQGFESRGLYSASQRTLDYLEGQLQIQKSKKRALYMTMKYLMFIFEDNVKDIQLLHDMQFLANVLYAPVFSGHKVTKVKII